MHRRFVKNEKDVGEFIKKGNSPLGFRLVILEFIHKTSKKSFFVI